MSDDELHRELDWTELGAMFGRMAQHDSAVADGDVSRMLTTNERLALQREQEATFNRALDALDERREETPTD